MTERSPTGLDAATHRKLMLVLAYLGPLALVPLLTDPRDADLRWHAKHGLILAGVELAALTLGMMVVETLALVTAGLFGCLFLLVSPAVLLGLLVLIGAVHALGMVRALNGERLLIPGISEYASKF